MALARVHGVVRYFHPSDSLDKVPWDRFLVHAAGRMGSIESAGDAGPRLEALYAPIVDGFKVAPAGTAAAAIAGEGARIEWRHLGYGMEPDKESPYVSWRTHHDPLHDGKVKGSYFQHRQEAEPAKHADPVERVALGGGLEAQVPISLPAAAAKLGDAQKARLAALEAELPKLEGLKDPVPRSQAHADGIALWNVARHFYPYGAAVGVDWDGMLREWLARQPASQSRAELLASLRRLTVPLQDGHARIVDSANRTPQSFLAISVRPVEGQWVVDASAIESVRVGDVVQAVDGKPAAQWFSAREALTSGSPQLRRWSVAREFLRGDKDSSVALRLARGKAALDVTLRYDQARPMQGPRPAAIAEVAPGIHYVDVSRFDAAAFARAIEGPLREAKGIVFDLRGYPSTDGFKIVPYWIRDVDRAQWMFVPRFDGPFGLATTSWSIGWQAGRNALVEKPAKVLLVDGRTISYAESLAAYFPAQKTGTMVGEPTAGANGNVAHARTPSGFWFLFTGMRVTLHDGKTLHHAKGIAPDVAASATLAGVAAGRDEQIERAVELLRKAPAR